MQTGRRQALTRARLLKHLGSPVNVKRFTDEGILELPTTTWLTKMTNVIYKRSHEKNAAVKKKVFPAWRSCAVA